MHILTKIFAVLAAVLALLFAALTTTYSLNADRLVAEYKELEARQSANDATLRTQATERSERVSSLEKEIVALRDESTVLQGTIDRLEAERFKLEAGKNQAESNAALVTGQVGKIAQTIDAQQELIANYRAEVLELRQQELDFRRREIELVDKLNELESSNDVLEQTVRALQVDLADARQDLAQRGAPGSSDRAGGTIEIAGEAITGEVTRVTTDADRQLAQISLGTNDRMIRNARLYIVRDGDFIANLVMEQVDVQSSVGVVDTLGANVTVRVGDRVMTTLETRAAR